MEGKTSLASERGLKIFQQPMCLVQSTEHGKLHIYEDVVSEIAQIRQPIVSVAIAGLYRTGKSFLMNRLAGSQRGFPVGSTIQAKTKGIWAWCREHPTQSQKVLLLLDTEGRGDIEKVDGNEYMRIFTVALLMCDVLCYNVVNVFDYDSVENLAYPYISPASSTNPAQQLIKKISKDIRNQTMVRYGNCLPDFILCIRDCHLRLETGGEDSSDAYLEKCLKSHYNRSKQLLRDSFPKRKCFTFDRPVGRRLQLLQLVDVSERDMNQDFLDDVEKFVSHIHTCQSKWKIQVNGQGFVDILQHNVKAIGDGIIPDTNDILMKLANIETSKLAKREVDIYRWEIERVRLPVLNFEKHETTSEEYLATSVQRFAREAKFDDDKSFANEVRDSMCKIRNDKKAENSKRVFRKCCYRIEQLYKETVGGKSKFLKIGGTREYLNSIRSMKQQYDKEFKEAEAKEKESAYEVFMRDHAGEQNDIHLEEERLKDEKDKSKRDSIVESYHRSLCSDMQRMYYIESREAERRRQLEIEYDAKKKEEEKRQKENLQQALCRPVVRYSTVQLYNKRNQNRTSSGYLTKSSVQRTTNGTYAKKQSVSYSSHQTEQKEDETVTKRLTVSLDKETFLFPSENVLIRHYMTTTNEMKRVRNGEVIEHNITINRQDLPNTMYMRMLSSSTEQEICSIQ